MSDQRHPYAGHPAALVLADHQAALLPPWPVAPTRCDCGWTGPSCDHPAHLADGPPPVTLTERILTERADRRTT